MADLLDFKDIYENYIGVGNRGAKIWFFGLEYGGGLDKNKNVAVTEDYFKKLKKGREKFIAYLSNNFADKNEGAFYGTLYYLLKNIKNIDYSYEDSITVNKESNFFYSNLSFLKFPREGRDAEKTLLEHYKKIFMNDLGRRDKYLTNNILNARYKKNFEKYLNEPKIIFFLNKSYLKKYQVLLGLTPLFKDPQNESIPVKWGNTSIDFYKSGIHTIINCPNFTIADDTKKELVKRVNVLL
ncbi:MAG: hypothetical protein M0Q21_08885 [Ignavibacteriaceae bacterium]|nr:hypothetical protein [Ignavibacteriaceae bacterium]